MSENSIIDAAALVRLAQGAPNPEIDPRLRQFQTAICSITQMRDAVRLVNADPSIQSVLINRGIVASEVDFNHDGNRLPDGTVGNASNREWASALIAAAQLTTQQGKTLNELNEADILAQGQRIYDQFHQRELADNGTCDVIAPIVNASRGGGQSR